MPEERHLLATRTSDVAGEPMSSLEDTDQDPLLDEEESAVSKASDKDVSIWNLRASFFLFGTINNGTKCVCLDKPIRASNRESYSIKCSM